MSSANLVKNLELAMQQEAELFVATGPTGTNVADLFLGEHREDEQAVGEILTSYDESAPEMTLMEADSKNELCVVAIPPGESGLRFGELTRHGFPKRISSRLPVPTTLSFSAKSPISAWATSNTWAPSRRGLSRVVLRRSPHTPLADGHCVWELVCCQLSVVSC